MNGRGGMVRFDDGGAKYFNVGRVVTGEALSLTPVAIWCSGTDVALLSATVGCFVTGWRTFRRHPRW